MPPVKREIPRMNQQRQSNQEDTVQYGCQTRDSRCASPAGSPSSNDGWQGEKDHNHCWQKNTHRH
jgi:hypothetical protein